MPLSPAIFRFDGYELDAAAGELRKEGVKLKIQPQPLKVLAYLASRQSEVVTREELREAIWGSETFVDFEQGLNYCIRQIRTVLAEDAEKPRYIQTLPKRGYRFVASGAVEAGKPVRQGWWMGIAAAAILVFAAGMYFVLRKPMPSAKPEDTTIGVLAFADLSPEKDREYFAHGLTEEIFSRLSSIKGLKVAGRASAFALPANADARQAGKRLGVRHVLMGSVRAQGVQARITVQLVDAENDRILWSESYDRKLADLLSVQKDIAQSVASTLNRQTGMALKPPQRPANVAAYHLYLRALHVRRPLTRPALEKAIQMLEEVVRMEPDFAAAYAQLAECHGSMVQGGFVKKFEPTLDKASAAADKAAALDPASSDAQAALGYVAMLRFRWPEAKKHLAEAVRLDPNSAFGHNRLALLHAYNGEVQDSLRESELAVGLDPLSLIVLRNHGSIQYYARRYNDALRTLQDLHQIDIDFTWAYYTASRVYTQKGDCKAAIEAAKTHSRLVGNPTSVLPLAIAKCEGPEAGRRALQQLIRLKGLGPHPAVHAAIGDKEKALQDLEKSVSSPNAWMWSLKVNPELDSLRGEPRFQAVLRKLGLSQ